MGQARRSATVELNEFTEEILEAHRSLLACVDLTGSLTKVFEKVGRAAGVDRVYIFENHSDETGTIYSSQRFEWVARGISPQIHNPELQNIALRAAGYSRWLDSFLAYQPIHGPIDTFPESERATLKAQSIESLLILPVFAGGTLWGFVGFDDCTGARVWTEAELDLLFALTITLGQVFSGKRGSKADNATIAAMSLVGSMLSIDAALLSETPVSRLVHRTRARLSVTVAAHRFFAEEKTNGEVDVERLFAALQPRFAAIRQCGGEESMQCRTDAHAESFTLGVGAALDIVMIVTEVLAVIAERHERAEATAHVTVILQSQNERAELVITARDSNGVPVSSGRTLDGMAFLMMRHLIKKLNGTENNREMEGMLYRLSFPV